MSRYVEPARWAASRIWGTMTPEMVEIQSAAGRSGFKYLETTRKGPQLAAYYQGKPGNMDPMGYNSPYFGWMYTEKWMHRKEVMEEKKLKGIMPIKKGQGKASKKKR